MVVQSAMAPDGGADAIVSLQLAALESGPLLAAGSALQVLPLPYPLLEDI
jgi:hypothetical protein